MLQLSFKNSCKKYISLGLIKKKKKKKKKNKTGNSQATDSSDNSLIKKNGPHFAGRRGTFKSEH